MRRAVVWLEDSILPPASIVLLMEATPFGRSPHSFEILVVAFAEAAVLAILIIGNNGLEGIERRWLAGAIAYLTMGSLLGYGMGLQEDRGFFVDLLLVFSGGLNGLVLYALLERLRPPLPDREGRSPSVAVPLGDDERAMWLGRGFNRGRLTGLLIYEAAIAVFALTSMTQQAWGLLVFTVFMTVFAVATSTIVEVMVMKRAIVVAMRPFGYPKRVIPFNQVRRAFVDDVSPWKRGGAGWQGGSAIIRRGEALSISLVDGQQVIASVDDADTGAALINSYLGRANRNESEPA
ncbi:MAG: hypothetical protein QOG54_187 [Actinomycetota bacterium]|nr:hypothetical protein [Actinomycetota bacterium]